MHLGRVKADQAATENAFSEEVRAPSERLIGVHICPLILEAARSVGFAKHIIAFGARCCGGPAPRQGGVS
jgi:hypothetical protein